MTSTLVTWIGALVILIVVNEVEARRQRRLFKAARADRIALIDRELEIREAQAVWNHVVRALVARSGTDFTTLAQDGARLEREALDAWRARQREELR